MSKFKKSRKSELLNSVQSKQSQRAWFLYIILCSNDSYYVGITPDVLRRFRLHSLGKGAHHTRQHRPVKLLYFKKFSDKFEARKREAQIKGWSRKKKLLLIEGVYK